MPTSDPANCCDANLDPGLKWGYGLVLNTEQQPGIRAAGSGAWAGISILTTGSIPRGITAAIYTQPRPSPTHAIQVYMDFERPPDTSP